MILGQIFIYGVLAGVALFLWYSVGADNWRTWWAWQWKPYVEWWGNWGDPFFASKDGQPYVKVIFGVIAVFLLFAFMQLSTWASMWVVGYVIMRSLLAHFGAVGVTEPSGRLVLYAVGCAVWLIVAKFVVSANMRQMLRNLWRKSNS